MNHSIQDETWLSMRITQGTGGGTRTKRRYPIDHSFWDEGNWARIIWASQSDVETNTAESSLSTSMMLEDPVICPLAGCGQRLACRTAFNSHYQSCHRHKCSVCDLPFPSAFWLERHVLESHDAYFAVQAMKCSGMYVCLVEDCTRNFNTATDRRKHLWKYHNFPKDFRLPRKRRQGKIICKIQEKKEISMEIDQTTGLLESMQISIAESPKPKIPKSICFGRGRGGGSRPGFAGFAARRQRPRPPRVCKFYIRGTCKFGSECKYVHKDQDMVMKDN